MWRRSNLQPIMEVVVPPDGVEVDVSEGANVVVGGGDPFCSSSSSISSSASSSPSDASSGGSFETTAAEAAALYGLPNGFHPDEKFDYAKYAAINGHVKNYSSYLLRHQEEIFSSPAFQSSVASACNKRNSEEAERKEMRRKEEEEEVARKKRQEVSNHGRSSGPVGIARHRSW